MPPQFTTRATTHSKVIIKYCLALQNFTPVLKWSAENATKLNVQIKPVEPTLEAGAQIQQMLTAECIDDYAGALANISITTAH